jgi:hypothetical protein
MHARITHINGSPDQIDGAVDVAKATVLPALQGCEGYKGFTVCVDHGTGKLVGISFFDTLENLEASAEAVRSSRDEAAQAAGADTIEFAHYEVVIDDEA